MRPHARSLALSLALALVALATRAHADPRTTMAVAIDCSAVRLRETRYLGGPLPPCTHVALEADTALSIAAVFAWDTAWGGSLLVGLGSLALDEPGRLPWLMMPVLGPVLAMQASQPAWEHALLVTDAAVQITGLMLFAAAEIDSHPMLVYSPSHHVVAAPRVTPLVGPAFVGASVAF